MPTYEYECSKCGHAFEQFQRMTEKPLQRCPKCKGKVKRLLGTGAGIIFKGSGFYETDYKTKTGSAAAGNDAPAAAKPKSDTAATPAATTPASTTPAPTKAKDKKS